MNDEELDKMYRRKNYAGDPYNFDLREMMDAFSFEDLCSNAPINEENGAVLLITGKQYILSYNAGCGLGPHGACMARIMKDIHGGGRLDQKSSQMLAFQGDCKLNGRILFERGQDEFSHRIFYQGFIHFDLTKIMKYEHGFSQDEYDMFMEFYEDHNDEIARCSDKYHLVVNFCYYNEEGKLVKNASGNLDALKGFIESHIVEKEKKDDDEVIINPPKRRHVYE